MRATTVGGLLLDDLAIVQGPYAHAGVETNGLTTWASVHTESGVIVVPTGEVWILDGVKMEGEFKVDGAPGNTESRIDVGGDVASTAISQNQGTYGVKSSTDVRDLPIVLFAGSHDIDIMLRTTNVANIATGRLWDNIYVIFKRYKT